MQMSIGVEYAFHSLFYMIDIPTGSTVGIKELAELNGLSVTYLSKVFTKLKKAGIVRSVPGAKGGYERTKEPNVITFWDVVEAVEGPAYAFQCAEIRQNNILAKPEDTESYKCPCLIKIVMCEAENEMRNYLRNKTLEWLYAEVMKDFPANRKAAIGEWIKESAN